MKIIGFIELKKVITYGTFDLFHFGHLEILRRAKELGNFLIVAVSSDEFNAVKGKKCIYPFQQRMKIVESIKYVDAVIPENEWGQKRKDILLNNIDVLVMGDDWKNKFDDLEDICRIIYLERTSGVSTTQIKKNIKGGKLF